MQEKEGKVKYVDPHHNSKNVMFQASKRGVQ